MRIYLDSTALFKRYIHESGSNRVLEQCAKADEIVVSVLCIPEMVSAFSRLVREKRITRDLYHLLRNEFREELQRMTVVDLTPEVISGSVHMLERETLGALDALYLSTAHDRSCDWFVTADRRQSKVAQRLGFSTVEI